MTGHSDQSYQIDVNDPKPTKRLSTYRFIRALLDQARLSSEATMSGLEFTEDAARQLERLYLTKDVVAQRAETIRRLALSG